MTLEFASVDDLASAIVTHGAPILFLDTAAILDIGRVAWREELQVGIVSTAAAMIADSTAIPRLLWTVATANVVQEFAAHRSDVGEELGIRIRNLHGSIAQFSSLAGILLPDKRITQLDWLDATLQVRNMAVMDGVVESTAVFRGSADCVARAGIRVFARTPPSSKERQEFKDCVIFEEFLELVTAVRRFGGTQQAIFVTPNKKDYGPPPRGFDQIAESLQAIDALYAADLAWAYSRAQQGNHNGRHL
jgi:hypothetical protein